MNDLIFLGGTIGCNHWREERVIPGLLARGVDPACLFNPVVDVWDQQARAREDCVNAQARYQVYVLASPEPASPQRTICRPIAWSRRRWRFTKERRSLCLMTPIWPRAPERCCRNVSPTGGRAFPARPCLLTMRR